MLSGATVPINATLRWGYSAGMWTGALGAPFLGRGNTKTSGNSTKVSAPSAHWQSAYAMTEACWRVNWYRLPTAALVLRRKRPDERDGADDRSGDAQARSSGPAQA